MKTKKELKWGGHRSDDRDRQREAVGGDGQRKSGPREKIMGDGGRWSRRRSEGSGQERWWSEGAGHRKWWSKEEVRGRRWGRNTQEAPSSPSGFPLARGLQAWKQASGSWCGGVRRGGQSDSGAQARKL